MRRRKSVQRSRSLFDGEVSVVEAEREEERENEPSTAPDSWEKESDAAGVVEAVGVAVILPKVAYPESRASEKEKDQRVG